LSRPLLFVLTMRKVLVDLHVHTSASFDCRASPEEVAIRCRALGLAPIFVTDHDTIKGAIQLSRAEPGGVIVGQEITTKEGEIIGLFLQQPIEKSLSATETALRIEAQGGLIYLQHPYDRFRRRLSERAVEALRDRIHIVEVHNSRANDEANQKAEELRQILDAAPGAGSDAHSIRELGSVCVEMEQFSGPDDFLSKLRASRIVVRPNRMLMRARSRLTTMRRR
jgi:predicted metal-dependent phosphoesterase TrpH